MVIDGGSAGAAVDAIEDDPAADRVGGPILVYRASNHLWGQVDRGLRQAALAAGMPGTRS